MLESLKRMEDVDGLPRLVPMAMSYCTGNINLSIHFVFRHCQLFLCHPVNGNCTAITLQKEFWSSQLQTCPVVIPVIGCVSP